MKKFNKSMSILKKKLNSNTKYCSLLPMSNFLNLCGKFLHGTFSVSQTRKIAKIITIEV